MWRMKRGTCEARSGPCRASHVPLRPSLTTLLNNVLLSTHSLLVRLFHPLLHAGYSENTYRLIVSDGVDSKLSLISTEKPRRLKHRK